MYYFFCGFCLLLCLYFFLEGFLIHLYFDSLLLIKFYIRLTIDIWYAPVFSLGDVVLKDLKLKAEALNALNLPVTVEAGFLGTITLKVIMSFLVVLCVSAIH